MGLGLFIAKTLLERTGAELTFANGADPFLSKPKGRNAPVQSSWSVGPKLQSSQRQHPCPRKTRPIDRPLRLSGQCGITD